ncbi:hypothetical protein ATERTT37_004742 [Aspergillus terreus]
MSLSRPLARAWAQTLAPSTRRHTSTQAGKTGPLTGITVVSLEQAIAAPFCTRQLADLGARVIKVERPGVGDFARNYDTRVNGLASHFVWTNRSKESLALDVKKPRDHQVLMRLLSKADVLVQNLAPGASARLGLSHEDLKATNPSLIVCNISGYGPDGPYRDKKAYDLLIQSEAGMLVNDMQGVWKHPQLKARGRWTEIDTPAGTVPALLPPGMDASVNFAARMDAVPAVGEHNESILAELGMKESR